jgi:hypothetical protein
MTNVFAGGPGPALGVRAANRPANPTGWWTVDGWNGKGVWGFCLE